MTSDLRIQGEVVVNSEQAESAFNRVGDKAQQMANEVATSATKAGQAVDKIGDGAGASAEKFTRAESRISASIKRATNELELLGKTASQRLEFNISDKGLDAAKFEPALKKLRELEAQAQAAQRAASGSLDKMGISAAQTAAALRGVPAQFTDIVTSLQGGQAPLTVFLQQGGQLKDMFGGAGAAARALGGYVVGLVNPFTVAAAAGVALALAYKQGSAEADAYNKALITTGNAAGTNAAQLKAYAQEISAVVGTQGKAAESLAALASTGKIGAESLKEAAQAAVQYERATGQAVGKTAEQFASLRNEPLAAVLKLNDGMNFLTDSTYKQIKSLEEQGKTAEAANVAQRAFADTLAGRAGEMERNLGTVERGWLAVKDAAKSAWDAILNVGRASTNVDQLAAVRKQIADRENQLANGGFGANGGGAAFGRPSQAATERLRAELSALQAQAAALEGVANQSRVAAEEERKRGEQVKATAAFDKAGEKFLTDKAKMERELAAARVQGAEAGKSQAEIEQRLAQIRESYAKKGASNTAAENKELRDQMRVFADLAGVSSTYYTELANYQKQRANNVITEQQYVQAVEALIKKQPFAVAIAKEQADATKAQAKASEEATKAHLKYVESFGKGAAAAQQQADQLRTEEAAAAIAADGYYSLAQAIELVTIARLEEKRDGLLGNEEAYLAVQKEIDARKELVGLIGAKEARKAAEDSAKDAAREWERAAADINRSLTDALLRGFESGKGFAKNFVDTMKNLFSTLVLRPIISAIVSPVAGAITGALGLAGTANAGTSALGTVGNIASGARLLGGLGAFGGGLSGGFGGLMGSLGLSATGTTLGGALSAGSIALQSGNILGGLGTFAGALGPIALGIGALTSLLGSFKGETRTGGQFGVAFDGSVTNQRRGQTYTIEGQQFDRDFTNGLQTALKDGIAYRLEGDPVAQESAIREAVAGTASGINGFLKALGSAATLTGFSAGLETSGKGRGGVFAGGLLSTGAAFGESGKGDNYAGTLYEAFSTNSPDFKTALENFTLDLKQATIQALQTVSDIPQAVQKLLKGVDAEGLTEDAANKLLETINAQIVGVNQFKDALKGMGLDTLAALSFDAAAGLAEVSGGFDKLLGNLQTYYTNFFTGEEQRANLQRSLAEQLSGLGLQLPDINASNARDQFRALVSAAEKDMSEAGRKTYATLLALSGAFASITDAAQTTTQTLEQQRQAYYGALQDAVSSRNKALQSQLSTAQEVESTLDNLFDILRSNVRELYGEVDGTRGMLATQGSAFIDQALAAAKKSGYLPDADKLAEAISAVRGGIDGGAYTTQFAADRDRLVLAGKLSGLQDIAGKQLTDAQKTVRALETQIDQNEQVLDYWKQQIDIASGTYDGILSVEAAVQQLSASLNPAAGKPGGANTVGGGSTPASGTGAIPRTSYGADEALTSFEKFKAWYTGLKSNADPSKLMGDGYQVPDWLRVSNFGADSYSDKDLFGSYLFFKNNPQYASDYQQIIDTGRSSYATDGSTLQRTDLSKLPKDIADYYSSNRNELLATEGFGLDPVLAYQLYNFGPGQFGLDGRKQSFTEWLQNTKWTPDGLVSNNNVVSLAQMGYSNYNLARWQLSSGNIVDRDGTIYTPDGKRVGRASQAQYEEVYGAGAKPTGGMSGAGDDYLSAIKTNIDSAINAGWSAQQLADGLISTGTSLKDVADAYGISVEQVKENLINGGATNIPKFAVGTNYVPRDMLAYIHEGEAVVPKAYNPAAGGGGAGSNAELVAEVRALREAVAALQAAANETAGNTRLMPQMGRQFDSVTLGGTAMRQKAVA